MSADKFEQLTEQLELFIDNTRQIGILVSDFQSQGQSALNGKLQNLVTGLQELDKMKGHMNDVIVPLEVFDYIDQGKNPQLYTKDCMERALVKNEAVKGKIDCLKKFKALLLVELSKVFPNEINKYRAVRGDDRTT